MSLNLEKHRHPQTKKNKREKVFVEMNGPMDKQRWEIQKMLSDPNKALRRSEVKEHSDMREPRASEKSSNIHSSTAGAGSGEFHVYRHNRRREEARLEYIEERKEQEEKQELFDLKMQTAQHETESKASKNRKKRQRAKMRKMQAKMEEQEGKASKKKQTQGRKAGKRAADAKKEDKKKAKGNEGKEGKEDREGDLDAKKAKQ